MSERVFFYGTLMTPFNRLGRHRVNSRLSFVGHGTIAAALFDLGIYPAAVPTNDGGTVAGEVYDMEDAPDVLAVLDEIEGYRPSEPECSLYTRVEVNITLEDGSRCPAWAYFYNAPLGRAQRIASGDYLHHLNVNRA
ncbi:MAG: gamma-glutamylcyclotransferase [Vicinamibacterales bacterium]